MQCADILWYRISVTVTNLPDSSNPLYCLCLCDCWCSAAVFRFSLSSKQPEQTKYCGMMTKCINDTTHWLVSQFHIKYLCCSWHKENIRVIITIYTIHIIYLYRFITLATWFRVPDWNIHACVKDKDFSGCKLKVRLTLWRYKGVCWSGVTVIPIINLYETCVPYIGRA
jgi:hypothetical protein